MASHIPPAMIAAGHNMERPWRARRVREYVVYHLGYFATREEAEAAEAAFDAQWPNRRGHPSYKVR